MNRKLTVLEKRKILERLSEPGATQCSVARVAGVSRRTVQNILKKRDDLFEQMNEHEAMKRCHVVPHGLFKNLDESIFQWFTQILHCKEFRYVSKYVACEASMDRSPSRYYY